MKIPVLYYHKIDYPKKDAVFKGLYVTPKQFKRQVSFLKFLGYETINPKEILSFIKGHKISVKKPILITFDDGYENNYLNAYPILKSAGFTSMIFMSSGFVGKKNAVSDEREKVRENFLNKTEIKEMFKSGFFIGSHGINHYYLDRLEDGVMIGELIASKAYLENITGSAVDFFSYPFGSYNANVMRAVKNAGYTAAFTTVNGKIESGDNSYELKRIAVNGYNSIFNFIFKIML
ncbi:MAG: polysaccharide deacetylase family protein [Candidatus Acidulodesulfobacterium sp.]